MSVNTARSVVLASADRALRQRLRTSFLKLNWQVREANGGAEAMAHLEEHGADAVLVDGWLPDLEAGSFSDHLKLVYPGLNVLEIGSPSLPSGVQGPWRHELLQALRDAMAPKSSDGPAWAAAPVVIPRHKGISITAPGWRSETVESKQVYESICGPLTRNLHGAPANFALPGIVGSSPEMSELARLVRLVAPHKSRVLIEGETGTGKDLVARAIHKLSTRAHKPLVTLNCAAIPETLLEAELFGHAKGAFTGATHSRVGRIEAAHGGTLFLDEIGELTLPLQAKLLRFLENGELQRVGENEPLRVDARVISATHQQLDQRVAEGAFRLDLLHRISVFPIEVPALRQHLEDLPQLVSHLLSHCTESKLVSSEALEKLRCHSWPGNVRELAHVLERGAILAEDRPELHASEIRIRGSIRG